MKNKIISITFILLLLFAFILNVILPSKDISFSERRNLFIFSDIKYDSDFSENFEKFALDQFIFRDSFRKLKSTIEINIFKKLDNNGLFVQDEHIFKQMNPLNKKSIINLSDKINEIYDLYLHDNDVYYSIIPDKNYYLDNSIYQSFDYSLLESILKDGVNENIGYINIFDSLTLDDYYTTDHHWKQNHLTDVINKIYENVEIDDIFNIERYEVNKYEPFYGTYYGQAVLNQKADELIYLNNEILQNVRVTIYEDFTNNYQKSGVYDFSALGSIDSYNMFLYGTLPIVTLENQNAKTDRNLILFKDSFSNSLVPLLLEQYSSITLIDLRLVNHTVLNQFIDFSNSDVIFMYSTLIINNSDILK